MKPRRASKAHVRNDIAKMKNWRGGPVTIVHLRKRMVGVLGVFYGVCGRSGAQATIEEAFVDDVELVTCETCRAFRHGEGPPVDD